MKALLDTSFVRHLISSNALWSLPAMTRGAGWEFLIPQAVVEELRRKDFDRQIEAMMCDGAVRIVSCTTEGLKLIKKQSLGLGRGETEALGVVNQCADRTFRCYVILTDDRAAQKRATKMGMNSLDVVAFLFSANQIGVVSKRDAVSALEKLADIKYRVSPSVRDDFLLRLR